MINYETTSWRRGWVAARRGWDMGIKGKIRGRLERVRHLAINQIGRTAHMPNVGEKEVGFDVELVRGNFS